MSKQFLYILIALLIFSAEGKATDIILETDVVDMDEPAQNPEMHPAFAEPELGTIMEAVEESKETISKLTTDITNLKKRVAILEKRPLTPK